LENQVSSTPVPLRLITSNGPRIEDESRRRLVRQLAHGSGAVAETVAPGFESEQIRRDYFRNLDSQGIHIAANAVISHTYLASLLDQPESRAPLAVLASLSTSPVKPGNGIGFGLGWYRHNGFVPPATPPGPPPGVPRGGNRN
jgi:hypothetical protein